MIGAQITPAVTAGIMRNTCLIDHYSPLRQWVTIINVHYKTKTIADNSLMKTFKSKE